MVLALNTGVDARLIMCLLTSGASGQELLLQELLLHQQPSRMWASAANEMVYCTRTSREMTRFLVRWAFSSSRGIYTV